MSEITQPARITIRGVRHAVDEARGALAVLFAIFRYPENLAARRHTRGQHSEAPQPTLTKVGDGPYPFRSWLTNVASRRCTVRPERGIVYTQTDSKNGGLVMTKLFRRGVFVLLLTCVAVSGAMTGKASAQGTVAQREACEGDAFRFCSEFIPIVHMIENCLSRNLKRLTPACQIQMRGGVPVSRRPR